MCVCTECTVARQFFSSLPSPDPQYTEAAQQMHNVREGRCRATFYTILITTRPSLDDANGDVVILYGGRFHTVLAPDGTVVNVASE